MNAQTAEQIGKLARQLKKCNMAASMDEAAARAGEIIRGSSCDGLTAGQLMKTELRELKKQVKEDNQAIENIKKKMKELKTNVAGDSEIHSAEKEEFSKARLRSGKTKCGVEDMNTVKTVAGSLQNNKKKK